MNREIKRSQNNYLNVNNYITLQKINFAYIESTRRFSKTTNITTFQLLWPNTYHTKLYPCELYPLCVPSLYGAQINPTCRQNKHAFPLISCQYCSRQCICAACALSLSISLSLSLCMKKMGDLISRMCYDAAVCE